MELNGIESDINCARSTAKYTARHAINVPAGNRQAGKAIDSRVKDPNSERLKFSFLQLIHIYSSFIH